MGFRVTDENYIPQFLENAKAISMRRVSIGYFGPAFVGKEITNTGKALVQEYGAVINVTDKMRGYFLARWGIALKKDVIVIPERAFFRTGAKKGEAIVFAKVKELIVSALLGEISVEDFCLALGDEMKEVIQETAAYWSDPSNAGLTVKEKGFDDPLIRTGDMIDAIEVIVR